MAKRAGSIRWLREHAADPFVQRARREGYRSRAAYKLLEIHRREGLIRRGARVVDLGAAPGGWSQVARELVGAGGRVVAVDLEPIPEIPGVTCLVGDVTDRAALAQVLEALSGQKADLVMSDMAPEMSGLKVVDQARSLALEECALACARQALRPGGDLLVKAFHGTGFDDFLRELRRCFASVAVRKPEASRGRSSEVYLLARGYRGV